MHGVQLRLVGIPQVDRHLYAARHDIDGSGKSPYLPDSWTRSIIRLPPCFAQNDIALMRAACQSPAWGTGFAEREPDAEVQFLK